MTNHYMINLHNSKNTVDVVNPRNKTPHQEFNQQKVLEARLNAWLQQKKIKLAPAEREKKPLHST